ncbi:helicase, partial [Oryctes borbonicus]
MRHWDCNKPLTDDYDRLEQNFHLNKTPENAKYTKKWKDKQIAQYATYLSIYGNNLEGNSIKSQAIVPPGKNNDSASTSKKQSKKSLQIIQENKKSTDQTTLAKEKKLIKELENYIRKEKNIENKLCHIRTALEKLTKEKSILKTELIKLRVYTDYINSGLTNKDSISIPIIKDIFLVVKKVLEENSEIKEKDRILLSKLLHELGFDEIARRNNLPTNIRYKKILDLNWVRFQLQHLGADMKRIAHGVYDPDVGFTPDPWQAEFINAIRENKSALVVAPTSSGKTFAAYYCMKRVLQESKDGVVVYVSPTKALVNQVEATIYSRFKNTRLPAGKAVVGVFTRDYKNNTLNSRILVTVPQCFEILLLSQRRYTWLKNLKYAIFDEVHKLTGSEEGAVWERCLLLIRCPFLALSATISDVPNFYNWLVSNENYKQEQDRLYGKTRKSYEVVLVEHTERHTDLVKYVYDIPPNLQHYHPYSALDSKTLKEHNGIPATLHLSPKEVWQLFHVMYSNEKIRRRFTEEYNIYQFFSCISESGFITRNDVSMYEKILAKMFYEIYEENGDIARDIVKELSPAMDDWMIPKLDHIPKLLNCMAERNLLPCIVFSYNRKLIEHANYLTIRESKNEVKKNERRVQGIDDETRARRKQKAEDKMLKIEKKERERREGNNDREETSRSIKSNIILKDTGSKFKGVGIADAKDVQWLEKRLANSKSNPNFVSGLAYGVAYHHGGLNNKLRSTAEILFRMGLVKVVFATGTLALGIHMPCKSVVIFGDSPYLNSIEYHQLSGRAGRRGFDTEGNVIFMGLTKNRQDMLMTERLPKMLGNFPVNVTLVARLLLLVTRVTDGKRSSEEVTNITISRALALLENSLIFRFKPDLKIQIKYFIDFAAQLLFIQGIYSAEGVPLKLANLVNHLHYHEPANLAFAYLFRCGAFRQLILSAEDRKDAE